NLKAAGDSYGCAIDALRIVLREQPDRAEAGRLLAKVYLGRAGALTNLGRFAEAIRDCDEALGLAPEPSRPQLRLERARAVARAGAHAAATAVARAVLAQESVSAAILYDAACVYSLSSVAAGKDAALLPAGRKQLAEQYTTHAIELLAK